MAGSSSRIRAAAHTPSGPGGMRMSRNATANGSSAPIASRTAATAAPAPSQKTGAKKGGPGGRRMSRNATANGSSAAIASRTAATAASAPSQKTGAKMVLRDESFFT